MSPSEDRLSKHLAEMQTHLSASVVLRFMTLLRQVHEEKGKSKTLTTLNIFCDWCLHHELNRAPARSIVILLQNALIKEMEVAGSFDPDLIIKILSPKRLLSEIFALLNECGLSYDQLSTNSWVTVLTFIVEEVLSKPLSFDLDRFAKMLAAHLSAPNISMLVRSITLEKNDNPQMPSKYVIKADVMPNPPLHNAPGFFLVLPFVIATNELGEPIA